MAGVFDSLMGTGVAAIDKLGQTAINAGTSALEKKITGSKDLDDEREEQNARNGSGRSLRDDVSPPPQNWFDMLFRAPGGGVSATGVSLVGVGLLVLVVVVFLIARK